MKIDLAKKSGDKGMSAEMPIAISMGKEKEAGPQYPCASLYDLPDGVKDLKAGDMVTLGAKIKSLRTNEEGIQEMTLEVMHIEDGKKDILLKNKKISDADEIDKGVDEAAEDQAGDTEED